MISTGIIVVLFIGSTWTKSVDGLPYSKVFVQSGPEVVPLEFVNYGPPPVAAPAVTQLSPAPIGQLVPCVGKCPPGQQFVSMQPPNANLVSYKPPVPTVPVVASNDNPPSGYQYSYVIYDQSTGDQKTQTEQSDGSLVQGQYSLIQPDGILREVIYTADDLKGFNAIVKNYPSKAENIEAKKTASDPCKQSEAFTELTTSKDIETVEDHTPGSEHKEGETDSRHEQHIGHTPHSEHDDNDEHADHKEHAEHTKNPESNQIATQTGLLSYSEIIKCLQAALENKNAVPKPTLPLTYVILNKPC